MVEVEEGVVAVAGGEAGEAAPEAAGGATGNGAGEATALAAATAPSPGGADETSVKTGDGDSAAVGGVTSSGGVGGERKSAGSAERGRGGGGAEGRERRRQLAKGALGNRRFFASMFGNHLSGAKKALDKDKSRIRARGQLESKAKERVELSVKADIEIRTEAIRKRRAEEQAEKHKEEAGKLKALWIKCWDQMEKGGFLLTETEPRLLWKPKGSNAVIEEVTKQSKDLIEAFRKEFEESDDASDAALKKLGPPPGSVPNRTSHRGPRGSRRQRGGGRRRGSDRQRTAMDERGAAPSAKRARREGGKDGKQ